MPEILLSLFFGFEIKDQRSVSGLRLHLFGPFLTLNELIKLLSHLISNTMELWAELASQTFQM